MRYKDRLKERIMKTIYFTKKGDGRWAKLLDADKKGLIKAASKRSEIGLLAGMKNYKNAHSLVSSMIKNGAIKEEMLDFNNGKPIYKYELAEVKKGNPVERSVEAVKAKSMNIDFSTPKNAKITIQAGASTIMVENAGVEYLIALVEGLSK